MNEIKYNSIVDAINNLDEKDVVILYNLMADDQGIESICPMEEFNDISFESNLSLIDSISSTFDTLDDYYVLSEFDNTFHSTSNPIDCIYDYSSMDDMVDFIVDHYDIIHDAINSDFEDTIFNDFISWAFDNYGIYGVTIEWLVNNANVESVFSKDWETYLAELRNN